MKSLPNLALLSLLENTPLTPTGILPALHLTPTQLHGQLKPRLAVPLTCKHAGMSQENQISVLRALCGQVKGGMHTLKAGKTPHSSYQSAFEARLPSS